MENLFDTIMNDYLVLVVVIACLVIGYIIKTSLSFIPNKYIPTIVAVVGAVVNAIVGGPSVETIVYGAFMGLASTGLHQLFVKWLNKNNKEDGSTATK